MRVQQRRFRLLQCAGWIALAASAATAQNSDDRKAQRRAAEQAARTTTEDLTESDMPQDRSGVYFNDAMTVTERYDPDRQFTTNAFREGDNRRDQGGRSRAPAAPPPVGVRITNRGAGLDDATTGQRRLSARIDNRLSTRIATRITKDQTAPLSRSAISSETLSDRNRDTQ